MELRVLALYPDQMNIYADRGNIVFLQRRCEWRGIGFSYAGATQLMPVVASAPLFEPATGSLESHTGEPLAEPTAVDAAGED